MSGMRGELLEQPASKSAEKELFVSSDTWGRGDVDGGPTEEHNCYGYEEHENVMVAQPWHQPCGIGQHPSKAMWVECVSLCMLTANLRFAMVSDVLFSPPKPRVSSYGSRRAGRA